MDVRRHAQADGAAVLLLVPVAAAALVVLVVAVTGATLLLVDGRARDAADEAAVAAVHAHLAGRLAPCDAARQAVASRTAAGRVVSCRTSGTGMTTVVVSVRVPSRFADLVGLGERRAAATAAPRWRTRGIHGSHALDTPRPVGRGGPSHGSTSYGRGSHPSAVRPPQPEPRVPFDLTDLDPRTARSVAAYDSAASEYQLRLRQHRPTTDIKRFTTGLDRGTLVLDAGCGPANDMRLLRDHGAQPIGLDLSAGALAHARVLLPRDGLVRGPIQEPPFAEGAFGGLWCNGGLTHMPRDQWRATFTALLRTVHSGPVMLSAYRGTVDLVEVDDDVLGTIHVSAATEEEIAGMFEERGLVDVRVEVRPDPLHGRRRPTVYAHARKPE